MWLQGEVTQAVIHEDLLNLSVVVALSTHKRYSGVLRKVGADFLLLEDSQLGMALVPLEHVKQLRFGADTTKAAGDTSDASMDTSAFPDSLCAALQSWTQTVVQLDGGGPDPVVCYVVCVKTDYLIASVIPEGMVYIPIHHIQLVRPLDVAVRAEFVEWASRQMAQLPAATRFVEALRHEVGRLVRIGRGGPDEISGILRQVHDEFVELVVSPHESTRIPTHHVKVVSRLQRLDWETLPETAQS